MWVFYLVVIMQLLIWGVASKTGASSMNGLALTDILTLVENRVKTVLAKTGYEMEVPKFGYVLSRVRFPPN